MRTRFKKNAKIFDIAITAVAGVVSVCTITYGLVACFVTEQTSKI